MRILVPLQALPACAPESKPEASGRAVADGLSLSDAVTLRTPARGAPAFADCGEACARWTWDTPQGETWWEGAGGQTRQGWRPARVTAVGPTALRFVSGDEVWSWRRIAACDATGRSLPVTLEVGDQRWAVAVDDAGARWPITIVPGLQRGAFLLFGGAEDRLGVQVSSAADPDADGFDDLMITAPFAPGSGINRGRGDIYVGGPGGLASFPARTGRLGWRRRRRARQLRRRRPRRSGDGLPGRRRERPRHPVRFERRRARQGTKRPVAVRATGPPGRASRKGRRNKGSRVKGRT